MSCYSSEKYAVVYSFAIDDPLSLQPKQAVRKQLDIIIGRIVKILCLYIYPSKPMLNELRQDVGHNLFTSLQVVHVSNHQNRK